MSDLKPGAPVAVGYEALPPSGTGPGVLALHAWWGLNEFFRSFCDRLAAAGFVVVAPDLWGGTVAITPDEAEGLVKQRDGQAMFQAASDALAYLGSHPAVRGEGLGAIGFSLGASWALTLAGIRPQLRAVTIFYGTDDADLSASQAAFLGHFAENDPYEEEAFVRQVEDAIKAAGHPVQFYRYPGVGHWFFEADRADAYDPAAAAQAWERTLAFLHERL
jgi:carboxymethylenebutenolidase